MRNRSWAASTRPRRIIPTRSRAPIDDEIRRIVDEAHERAEEILLERRDALTRIAEILLDRETIAREQFESLLAGDDERDGFKNAYELPVRRSDPVHAERASRRAIEGTQAVRQ